ncbi:MAG TPA: hypothetical protein VG796_24780 [Verrucomicrobiales bacterium]|nr:hypothetical protein [Verrucomicrobiales bacterium]
MNGKKRIDFWGKDPYFWGMQVNAPPDDEPRDQIIEVRFGLSTGAPSLDPLKKLKISKYVRRVYIHDPLMGLFAYCFGGASCNPRTGSWRPNKAPPLPSLEEFLKKAEAGMLEAFDLSEIDEIESVTLEDAFVMDSFTTKSRLDKYLSGFRATLHFFGRLFLQEEIILIINGEAELIEIDAKTWIRKDEGGVL